MPTNKPEVVLPEAPPIPAHLFDKDQSIVWAAAWETLRKHIADTLTRPADGDFVMVPRSAIDWLNGEGPEGFECPPDRYFRGEPPRYWWRSVFREKAGLCAASKQHGQEDECETCGRRSPLQPAEYTQALDVLGNFNPGADQFTHSLEVLRQHQPQQPGEAVAVEFDGTDSEVLREFIRLCREVKPVGQWPGERVCAAIERSMANEKPFRFIAEADMAPERGHNGRGGDADRLLSGPRRSPRPAIDIGKLRQIAAELRDNAHEHRQEDREVGMLADEQEAQFNEELAERIEAALIGDGGEKGNG